MIIFRTMKRYAELFKLFSVFFRIGLFTFGGGYAMISIVETECVERRHWITQEEMDDLIVVAESTPGPIAINCATYVGARHCGFLGAVCGTLGMVFPSFLVIFLLSRFMDDFLEIRFIANAFRGIKLAVGILILDAGRRLFLRLPKKILPLTIFFLSLIGALLINYLSLRLSSMVLMLAAAGISLLFFAIRKGDDAK